MRVLYITGWCRSGSTVLGNILGEVAGVIHVGELHYLWRNGVVRDGTNTSCGCGEPVADCSLWSKVIGRVCSADTATVDTATQAIVGQRTFLRTRHTRSRLAEVAGRRQPSASLTQTTDLMVATYQAIAAETEARLVVDSSKYPAEPAALLGRPEVDLRVLHLVRDPRASANSWRRPKAYIPAMGVLRSTGYWVAANLASERVGRAAPQRYLRLRYEDFAADPRAALTQVLRFAGLADRAPVDEAGRAELGVNHTVTGNPDRLVRGPIHVRPDDQWRSELPTAARLLTTAFAAPALSRYGYQFGG